MLARVTAALLVLTALVPALAQYQPTWESLDSRPLPEWYDAAKVGIFIHWGVFSVPSFGSEWFWKHWRGDQTDKYVQFMEKNYRPGFTYADFAPDFTAEFYDPAQWADLFQKSGAKYVVLTSKHHEGFTLWPSKYSWNWNALDVGPKRDLLGDLATAIRNRTDLHFGLYHSLYEWFNPLYLNDRAANRSDFVTGKTIPELHELVETYRPDVIWSDGDWDDTPEYWTSKEFLAWLYNDSPVRDTVVTNDRWGQGTMCEHGGFLTCSDHYNPGHLLERKWENAFTLDRDSWGFRREMRLEDVHAIEEVLAELAETVSCGGNVLINVGPTRDGRIVPVFEERLTQLGEWLGVNGAAIYGSRPWTVQNDTLQGDVWYTQRAGDVYAIALSWPAGGQLRLGSAPQQLTSCQLLGHGPVPCQDGVVEFPDLTEVTGRWAWVVRFSAPQSDNQVSYEVPEKSTGEEKVETPSVVSL
ncbi:alpha-L-fucosidase-like [Amphibalanus amphitrite]|uniref:alpha-L-fucosidase-like n=1 Tax=Amphibalanus amphitrite TaxID=1232801 RepID=UPI001C917B42|nr:alpha-L-fucosidase-like [Amphibalanus amphitrite]